MRGVRGGHAEPRMLTEAERRDALLSAAERVFLAKGYVSTTMADIAQAAGMSKKTIYQVFDSKKELFDALMMDRITVLKMPAEDADRPPAVILRAVLLEISRFVLAPKQIALTRLILAEIASTPEVGDVMKTRCVQVETMMQNWLALQISRGVFDIPDIPSAAAMWRSSCESSRRRGVWAAPMNMRPAKTAERPSPLPALQRSLGLRSDQSGPACMPGICFCSRVADGHVLPSTK
jgi:AcrR family transcriptional regulator